MTDEDININDPEALHYYLISFDIPKGAASIRLGWREPYVNETRLDEARKRLYIGFGSTPIAVSYLGLMTRRQARGD